MRLVKTSATSHLIPNEVFKGSLEFKIRTFDRCDVASAYSRTMVISIEDEPGVVTRRKCDDLDNNYIVTKRRRQKDDDEYDSRLANAV